MNSGEIFALALGLQSPWEIKEISFKKTDACKELHISIDFKRGSKFPDSKGQACEVYDTKQKTWRHLNFFEHSCYLHCRVPRIRTSDGKTHLIDVPWARAGSGFTLLFEAYVMSLIENEMPMNKIAALTKVDAHRLWTIFNYWINQAYDADDPKDITQLGIDETSQRRGHKYVTIGVDLERRKVIHATKGKDAKTLEKMRDYLVSKGIDPEQIAHASIDLSPSFISGLKKYFPKAEIHFDRFHVKKLLNEAMDDVRKLERKEHKELKGYKYIFLKNNENLTDKRRASLNELITLFPTLGEAYRLKELFDDVWDMETKEEASSFLDMWIADVNTHKIAPFMKFARTVRAHQSGIINFVKTRINNGILEGINSKVQLAKRRARGYRNIDNLINMIYFLCGKLKFDYPLNSS